MEHAQLLAVGLAVHVIKSYDPVQEIQDVDAIVLVVIAEVGDFFAEQVNTVLGLRAHVHEVASLLLLHEWCSNPINLHAYIKVFYNLGALLLAQLVYLLQEDK